VVAKIADRGNLTPIRILLTGPSLLDLFSLAVRGTVLALWWPRGRTRVFEQEEEYP
jgi:hypothetical protein